MLTLKGRVCEVPLAFQTVILYTLKRAPLPIGDEVVLNVIMNFLLTLKS